MLFRSHQFGQDYRRSGREAIGRFVKILEASGIPATVRRRLGADIDAACGQLRREAKGGTTA